MAHEGESHNQDPSREAHERFVMPIVVPIIVFLFGVLSIYGLSRIYLELDTYHVRDVSMATPLAIGVALLILLVATYLASRPVPVWQLASIMVLAASLLTGGSIWAAVHEESEPEGQPVANGSPTPPGGGTPPAGPVVQVALDEFDVAPQPDGSPPGPVTFDVTNEGSTDHEFIVISTDLPPDGLTVDENTFAVDLTALDVVGEIGTDQLASGASASTTVDLQPGPYILICNVPSHYESGMHAGFTVQ